MSEEINRLQTKIRILKETLESGKFIIIAKDDPDYPQGLELPMPKSWQKPIKKAIKTLHQKLKKAVDELISGVE